MSPLSKMADEIFSFPILFNREMAKKRNSSPITQHSTNRKQYQHFEKLSQGKIKYSLDISNTIAIGNP
jgi:hypothetical protein